MIDVLVISLEPVSGYRADPEVQRIFEDAGCGRRLVFITLSVVLIGADIGVLHTGKVPWQPD